MQLAKLARKIDLWERIWQAIYAKLKEIDIDRQLVINAATHAADKAIHSLEQDIEDF